MIILKNKVRKFMEKILIYNLFKNKKRLKNGIFVSVEGLDASGKETQVKLLEDYLVKNGYKVKVFSFPQYETLIGKVIASYLKGDYGDIHSIPKELICIAYAADRVKVSNEIRNLLNAGYIVIANRFTYSNIFSAAKLPKDQWMSFVSWIEQLEFEEMNIVRPHYNFYLHVDPEISIQRIKERGKRDYQDGKEDIHENNNILLKNASEIYLQIAKSNPQKWYVINQMKDGKQISKEETFKIFKKKFLNILN